MEQNKAPQRKKIKRILAAAFLLIYAAFSAVVLSQGKWDSLISACGLADEPQTDLPFSVRIFNVGSADCILIQNGEYAMLIDSATADKGAEIAQKLHRLGVDRLDYVVATHAHSDHTGGFSEILSRIPAEQALIAPLQTLENYTNYRNLNKIFIEQGVPVHEVQAGARIAFGNQAEIQILSAGIQSDNENEASIVLRIVYGDVSMLFMGDAETETEEILLSSKMPLQSDFIKLGHHGSKTSSSLEFLQAVDPNYAAVSCGEASPLAEDTLLNLDQLGLRAYRTDLDGDLLFATDGTLCEMKYTGIS